MRPSTRGATVCGAKKKTKNKLSSQSDDDDGIDSSLCKPPPETLATMPSLVALPSLKKLPSKNLRTGRDDDFGQWDGDDDDKDLDFDPIKHNELVYTSDKDDDYN